MGTQPGRYANPHQLVVGSPVLFAVSEEISVYLQSVIASSAHRSASFSHFQRSADCQASIASTITPTGVHPGESVNVVWFLALAEACWLPTWTPALACQVCLDTGR
jgi:hypothetical protein